MSCKKYKKYIAKALAEQISPADWAVFIEHTKHCSECKALLQIHTTLNSEKPVFPMPKQEEFGQMRAEVMRRVQTKPPKKQTLNLGELWHNIYISAWRPAVAFSLILGFLLGRIMPTEESNLGSKIIDGITTLAKESTQLFTEDKSKYRYANVSFKELNENKVEMSFDVSTRVDVVREKDDPLFRELLAQTLLSPVNTGTRLKAIGFMENLTDPKLKQALIHTLHHEPSPAVRMEAVHRLQQFPRDDDIARMMREVIKKEEMVKMRFDALDYLIKSGTPPDTLKRIVESLDAQKSKAIMLRANKITLKNKERE
jgi:hypothetical protein